MADYEKQPLLDDQDASSTARTSWCTWNKYLRPRRPWVRQTFVSIFAAMVLIVATQSTQLDFLRTTICRSGAYAEFVLRYCPLFVAQMLTTPMKPRRNDDGEVDTAADRVHTLGLVMLYLLNLFIAYGPETCCLSL